MTQHDWVGVETPAIRPTKPARDTRDSVADQKSVLSLTLHRLCQYCPEKIRSGDVFKTREWVMRQAAAKKTAAKACASINEIQMAVTSLWAYLSPAEIERFSAPPVRPELPAPTSPHPPAPPSPSTD